MCGSAGGSGFLQEVIVLLYIAKSFLEKTKNKTKKNPPEIFLSENISTCQDPQALNKNDDGRPDGWWEMLESRCVEGWRWWRNAALMLGRVLDRGAGGWLRGGERLNILLKRS